MGATAAPFLRSALLLFVLFPGTGPWVDGRTRLLPDFSQNSSVRVIGRQLVQTTSFQQSCVPDTSHFVTTSVLHVEGAANIPRSQLEYAVSEILALYLSVPTCSLKTSAGGQCPQSPGSQCRAFLFSCGGVFGVSAAVSAALADGTCVIYSQVTKNPDNSTAASLLLCENTQQLNYQNFASEVSGQCTAECVDSQASITAADQAFPSCLSVTVEASSANLQTAVKAVGGFSNVSIAKQQLSDQLLRSGWKELSVSSVQEPGMFNLYPPCY